MSGLNDVLQYDMVELLYGNMKVTLVCYTSCLNDSRKYNSALKEIALVTVSDQRNFFQCDIVFS